MPNTPLTSPPKQGSAAARYGQIAAQARMQFLQRARHNALLSIPSLMPLDGQDSRSHLVEPYQGLAAAGVVHLSSRLTMALLPAGRPHMRLDLPPEILMQNQGQVSKDIEIGLALAERLVQKEVEDKDWRPSTLMSMQQIIVCGNVLEHMMPDNRIRVFRMDQFVVRRDYAGRILEGILEEILAPDALPEDIDVPSADPASMPTGDPPIPGSFKEAGAGATSLGGQNLDGQVRLYTWILRQRDGTVEVHQEMGDGRKVTDTLKFTDETLPYNFIRWSKTPGEDYGRSFMEEHIADIRALEGLTKAELEIAAMASRNFIAVRPGAVGATVKRRLTQAVNGDVVMMDPEAVELKSFDNSPGFQLVNVKTQQLTEALSRAFMLFSAGQRNAERVTATEIERDIQELEAALGGNFSSLNTDMMDRRTRKLLRNMTIEGKLPPEVTSTATPTVLSGLEALSRERDVSRVQQLSVIAQGFGEVAIDTLKLDKILAKATVGLGFPDAIRSDDEVAQRTAQRQQAELAQAAVGPAINAASKEGGA